MPMTRGTNRAVRPACLAHGQIGPGAIAVLGGKGGGAEVERMGLYVALGFAALKRRMGSEEGATAVEYALMIALIALVVVVAVTFLGQETNSVYENGELITALT